MYHAMILMTTFFVKFSSSKRMGAPTDKLAQGLAEVGNIFLFRQDMNAKLNGENDYLPFTSLWQMYI